LFNKLLSVAVYPSDIDRVHRIGKIDENDSRPRVMIVKFVSYDVRSRVYKSRRNAFAAGIYINDHLTRRRADLLYQARLLKIAGKVENAWSYDGNVMLKTKHAEYVTIQDFCDLDTYEDETPIKTIHPARPHSARGTRPPCNYTFRSPASRQDVSRQHASSPLHQPTDHVMSSPLPRKQGSSPHNTNLWASPSASSTSTPLFD
jgi:hypothetical protein